MIKILISTLVFIIILVSCQKTEFETSPDFKLEFSTDSIVFDTIFSGIGSTTRHLKIYNPSSKDIEITKIFLAKGEQSKYRINIDGQASDYESNITIKGKDSLYLFVEVSINTNQDALLEQDSIVFNTNGNIQDIKLLAWGQDVHLINGKIIQSENWTDDKPYLIYNSILVDTNQVLNINAGTKIYFHRGSRMYIAGTLEIDGSFEKPVIMQGDRLEQMYSDVPGQWEGIWLMNGSKHNHINWAEIKNAIIGIQVDTLADINIPTLNIHNSKIEHMSFAGIYAQGSTVFATNCLISDCGFYNLALTIGGNYNFYHCTLANYWQNSYRNTPSLIINNYYTYQSKIIVRDIIHAGFYNCLIYGNRENEILIDALAGQGLMEYEFDNCLLRYNADAGMEVTRLNSCIVNKDPLFWDIDKYKFEIDTLSPAIDKASKSKLDLFPALLNFDLKNNSRILDSAPDIGAFEWAKNESKK